jgi:hypothetical protein
MIVRVNIKYIVNVSISYTSSSCVNVCGSGNGYVISFDIHVHVRAQVRDMQTWWEVEVVQQEQEQVQVQVQVQAYTALACTPAAVHPVSIVVYMHGIAVSCCSSICILDAMDLNRRRLQLRACILVC